MPHCNFTKKNGEACSAWAVHGQERCIWHVEQHTRKEIRERVLGRGEQIVIIGKQVRSLLRAKLPPLEKAREVRGLVQLLKELEDGNPPDNGGEKKEKGTFEKSLEEWNKKKSQT